MESALGAFCYHGKRLPIRKSQEYWNYRAH